MKAMCRQNIVKAGEIWTHCILYALPLFKNEGSAFGNGRHCIQNLNVLPPVFKGFTFNPI